MRRALALVACLSLPALSGCGSEETADSQPLEKARPDVRRKSGGASEGEPRRPLLASYEGTWESPAGKPGGLGADPEPPLRLTAKDDGRTLQVSLAGEGDARWERLELALTRQDGALTGPCTFAAPDVPETTVKCELRAAEGGGLTGRVQTAWVDEDGAVLTFDAAPQWAPLSLAVRAPEPAPTASEAAPAEGEPTVAMNTGAGESGSGDSGASSETPTDEPPATGEEPPATGEEPPATGEEPPATGEEPPMTSEEPPATGEEPPATSEEPPATSAEPPATGEEPPATGEEPPATGEEPPATEEPPELEVDPAAAEAARKAREERLKRKEEDARLRERRKTPDGLARLMFEAVQKNDGVLFVKCLISSPDGLYLFASNGEQEVKLTYNGYNRMWRARSSVFPDAAQGEFVRLEASESQGKIAQEVREAVLIYKAAGQEHRVSLGHLMQVEDKSWKAYRTESE